MSVLAVAASVQTLSPHVMDNSTAQFIGEN
jgi:hypothetical protein